MKTDHWGGDMGPSLILVDGMTGSGKSTTTQKLCLHLLDLGRDAVWFYEHDTAHPIWPADEHLDPLLGTSRVLSRWQEVAATLGDRIVLMESAFLTRAGYLLAQNVPTQAIEDYVAAVESVITPARPAAIHFRTDDVTGALRRISADRSSDGYEAALIAYAAQTPYGQAQGIEDLAGVAAFFQRWQDLVDALFERLQIRKLAIEDPWKDWGQTERRLVDFLGIPEMPDRLLRSPALVSADRYQGTYRDTAGSDALVVAADAQGLYLEDARSTRLYHRQEHTFQLQSINVEVVFEAEEGGVFQRLRLAGNLPGMSPVWQRISA